MGQMGQLDPRTARGRSLADSQTMREIKPGDYPAKIRPGEVCVKAVIPASIEPVSITLPPLGPTRGEVYVIIFSAEEGLASGVNVIDRLDGIIPYVEGPFTQVGDYVALVNLAGAVWTIVGGRRGGVEFWASVHERIEALEDEVFPPEEP